METELSTRSEIRRLHTVCRGKDSGLQVAINTILELMASTKLSEYDYKKYSEIVDSLKDIMG